MRATAICRSWAWAALLALALSGCGVAGARPGECAKDEDCVGDVCCHAARCVPRSRAPRCDDVKCTRNRVPGTLDYGACACEQRRCVAHIAPER